MTRTNLNGRGIVFVLLMSILSLTACGDSTVPDSQRFETLSHPCELISHDTLIAALNGPGSSTANGTFPQQPPKTDYSNSQKYTCDWEHELDTSDIKSNLEIQKYRRHISVYVTLYEKQSNVSSIEFAEDTFDLLQDSMGTENTVPVGDDAYTNYGAFGPGEWLIFRRANITVWIGYNGTNVQRQEDADGSPGKLNTLDIPKQEAHDNAVTVAKDIDQNLLDLM